MTDTQTRSQWLAARLELLEMETAHARLGDELAAQRRAMPKLRLQQNYIFDGPNGRLSSANNSFNADFEVSPTDEQLAAGQMRYNYQDCPIRGKESHGVSVLERAPDGTIYHTYSTYARGLDRMNAAYGYLDLCPKGRQEEDLAFSMAWVKRHDEY